MNILYGNVSRSYYEMVIRKIKREVNVEKQLAITELYRGSRNIFDRSFEFDDVYYARYELFKEYKECWPVDEKVMSAVQQIAMETLKMMDRPQSWQFSYEERMQLFYKHVFFWNSILDMYSIDCAIFFNVPHEVFDFVIYSLCKIKGIKTYVLFIPPIFEERGIVSRDFLNEWKIFSRYMYEYDLTKESFGAKKIYKKYYDLATDTGSFEQRNWVGARVDDNLKTLTWLDIRKKCWEKKSGETETGKIVDDISNAYIVPIYKWDVKRIYWTHMLKTIRILHYYERKASQPINSEKYIYFSLHYQPEATSEPWGGGMFSNQLIPIKMISKYLPKGYMLYVKEHPSQTYVGRSKIFYDEICKLKNVRLISQSVCSQKLLANAVANATLTGTVCMESVLNGVPCLSFGKYIYNAMEGVLPVRTNEECSETIKRIIDGKVLIKQANIERFFCALYEYSKDINVGYGVYNSVKSAETMADEFISVIGEDF